MCRCLYVVFYRTGEIYAGRYYNFGQVGTKYYGSSSIAEQLKLQVAHIIKWKMPPEMTDEECAAKEVELICYIANRYGLHNLVFYRGDKEFYSQFEHNGRCINCHCKNNSDIFPALQKTRLDAQAMELYGVPFDDVTEEMRDARLQEMWLIYRQNNKEKIAEYLRNWRTKNKEYIAQKGKERYQKNKEKLVQDAREYRQGHKKSISKNKKKYYKKHSRKIIAYHIKLRDMAREIFGQSEYVDINGERRTISVADINAKHLRFEPQKEMLKKFYDADYKFDK